jgi:3-oxoacyl-[acyl-carrier protein] reductase
VKQPVDGLILSNTARAGVVGLMKTLSNELGPFGIGVNVICPGYTRTDRLVELASRLSQQEGVPQETIYSRWTSQIPMGRLGEPSEFASVVAFLCSDRSSYVTGTCLQVDGGVVKGVF